MPPKKKTKKRAASAAAEEEEAYEVEEILDRSTRATLDQGKDNSPWQLIADVFNSMDAKYHGSMEIHGIKCVGGLGGVILCLFCPPPPHTQLHGTLVRLQQGRWPAA